MIAALYRAREKLAAEIATMQARLAGLDMAIQLLKSSNKPLPRKSRGSVKEEVLSCLIEAGPNGANATTICAQAAERGLILSRATVSSLLSRLKREGTLTWDGARYRIGPEGSKGDDDELPW